MTPSANSPGKAETNKRLRAPPIRLGLHAKTTVTGQDMLTIYGVHRSRASRNIWLAKELGIPYRVKPVIQAYRLINRAPGLPPLNTRSPEFLRVNPLGLIPAIEDDGLVLTESLAINHYLARKHGGPLAPATLAEEGEILRWSFWAATDLEQLALTILMHRASKAEDERQPELADNAEIALRDRFPVLDSALAKSGYLVGGRFTVADLNVAEVIRYALPAPDLVARNPHVRSWLEACHARPAFREMWAEREAEPV